MGAPRPWLTWTLRLVAGFTLLWSLVEPLGARARVVSAAEEDSPYFAETGFSVAPGALYDYFRHRGGVRTFGPPISNRFSLLGQDVQIFRRHVLGLNLDGSVATISLLDTGAVPSTSIGGRTLPDADDDLVYGAPRPGTADYATLAQAFVRANAPEQWEGERVGFHSAFLQTVKLRDAFPTGGGDAGLLPGFAQEIWGLPVSQPMRDPQVPDVIYLRWERGVMAYDRRANQVQVAQLGEMFKAVLTGENLPTDLAAAAEGSPFYRQFAPNALNGVARPAELPRTVLAGAFPQPAVSTTSTQAAVPVNAGLDTYGVTRSAAQVAAPAGQALAPVAQAAPSGVATATPAPGSNPVPPAATPATATPAAAASPAEPDICVGDERITYAPANPRVGTELLIAVTSSRPHAYARLAGTERTTFLRERPGQLGIVYEWTVNLSSHGDHEYTFYVDSTIPCKKKTIEVKRALNTRR